ncbi:MAG: ferritin family protein [Firmicutes bacterium]|nr:ferritin family protein [Bacillota bacterium]
MKSSDSEITEILAKALQLEKNGLKTYLEYAGYTEDKSGKDMFIILARDEFEHMTIIEKVIEEYSGKSTLVGLNIGKGFSSAILPDLKDIDNYRKGGDGTNQFHALEMALKFESRSRELYLDLAEKAQSVEAESMFLTLAEMEKAHYEILEAQKNSIAGTGLWIELAGAGMENLL